MIFVSHVAAPGDGLQMAIALRQHSSGRRAWYGARSQRHDDFRLGVACRDLGIDFVTVVRAISREGRDGSVHFLEQRADLPSIIGVGSKVQFAPRPASCLALRYELLARPAEL